MPNRLNDHGPSHPSSLRDRCLLFLLGDQAHKLNSDLGSYIISWWNSPFVYYCVADWTLEKFRIRGTRPGRGTDNSHQLVMESMSAFLKGEFNVGGLLVYS